MRPDTWNEYLNHAVHLFTFHFLYSIIFLFDFFFHYSIGFFIALSAFCIFDH